MKNAYKTNSKNCAGRFRFGHDSWILRLRQPGSLWIIEAETEPVVSRLLCELGVTNVEISPVNRTLDLLDAHIEHRENAAAMLLNSTFDRPKA